MKQAFQTFKGGHHNHVLIKLKRLHKTKMHACARSQDVRNMPFVLHNSRMPRRHLVGCSDFPNHICTGVAGIRIQSAISNENEKSNGQKHTCLWRPDISWEQTALPVKRHCSESVFMYMDTASLTPYGAKRALKHKAPEQSHLLLLPHVTSSQAHLSAQCGFVLTEQLTENPVHLGGSVNHTWSSVPGRMRYTLIQMSKD